MNSLTAQKVKRLPGECPCPVCRLSENVKKRNLPQKKSMEIATPEGFPFL